jgi:GTP-binding protein LepA
MKNIRNFSIIAHIDHGKSTLADRLLEYTGTISAHQMREQVLDDMDLERERGITIKAHPVRLKYKDYILNLIDTPGHVDFTYEVSRSLAAGEGAVLLVDATQGVQAQTLAHTRLALENNLKIIPVINKIDLPNADIEGVKEQIKSGLSLKGKIILASAKEGTGTEEVLEAVVKEIPSPKGGSAEPLQALIFDSFFNPYRGIIAYVRMVNGVVRTGQKIMMMSTGKIFEVEEVGTFRLKMVPQQELRSGEVGYLITNIKELEELKIGDTVTEVDSPTESPLPGYKEMKPVVFSCLYPVDNDDYESLREALQKLRLNDPSFTFEPESSSRLGFGFNCGFLGVLHMEIVQERLEREYELTLIATAPNVAYQVTYEGRKVVEIDSPTKLDSRGTKVIQMEEPYIRAFILTPADYLGSVMKLIQNKRGIFKDMKYLSETQVSLTYEMPLAEMISEFYDKLKSVSKGYASFDYEHIGYKVSKLVKMDILINYEVVGELSLIIPGERIYLKGRELTQRLKEILPRQQFAFPVQARVGNKIIARETVRAFRKDVTAKLYGGDVTRKRKLLEKQREGKKRMKKLGTVEVTQEAFMALLKI